MSWYGYVLIGIAVLAAVYMWLIAPARKRPDDSALHGWLYAHRGFHDDNRLAPENSLTAFRLAVENGYGMELDVQHTKDDKLVVFHDANLKRVCGVDKRIAELTYAELCGYPLPNGEKIPLFSEVLALVDGRTPMIVEIKQYGNVRHNAEAALSQLRAYHGAYCVESFHPLAVQYFKKNAPEIIRGQLASGGRWSRGDVGWFAYFALKYLLVNVIGRPHFIAYSVPRDHNLSMCIMKNVYHPLLAAWTIRKQELLDHAMKTYDYPIFESFAPKRRNNR